MHIPPVLSTRPAVFPGTGETSAKGFDLVVWQKAAVPAARRQLRTAAAWSCLRGYSVGPPSVVLAVETAVAVENRIGVFILIVLVLVLHALVVGRRNP